MKIATSDLSAGTLDSILSELNAHGVVTLSFEPSGANDPFAAGILAAALSQSATHVEIDLSSIGSGSADRASLARSLLYQILLANQAAGEKNLNPHHFLVERPIVMKDMIILPPGALPLTTVESFRTALAPYLRRANIFVPEGVLGAIATIAFEAATNAEEHGSTRSATGNQDVLRFVAVAHQPNSEGLADFAPGREYLSQYQSTFPESENGWLQVIAVDAGMGIPYPGYRQFAEQSGWPSNRWNVYDMPFDVEQERTRRALNLFETTKGAWGKVINRQTPPGRGTHLIRIRLGVTRGFAAVRTGRSLAYWSQPYLQFGVREKADPIPYETSGEQHPLFKGTAWTAFVPLDQQLNLELMAQ